MSVNYWIIAIVVAVLAGGLLLAAFKGVVKMVLLAASIVGAVLSYYWLQKYGFSYLSFITDEPAEWMVTTVAVVGAVFVFAVFQHGLSWFSNIFSWEGKLPGMGGAKGALTSVLMCLFIVWLVSVGISYFGSLSDIRRYKDVAANVESRKQVPLASRIKYQVESSKAGKYLAMLDPIGDEERLKLAKLVAYMASEENAAHVEVCVARLAQYVPNVKRIGKLSTDKGIRSAMKKNDMGSLLNDPKLTKLLSDDQIRGGLKTFDPDELFGMAKAEKNA